MGSQAELKHLGTHREKTTAYQTVPAATTAAAMKQMYLTPRAVMTLGRWMLYARFPDEQERTNHTSVFRPDGPLTPSRRTERVGWAQRRDRRRPRTVSHADGLRPT